MNELKINKDYLLADISVSMYKCFDTPGNNTSTGRCDKKNRAEPVLTASNMPRLFEASLWCLCRKIYLK